MRTLLLLLLSFALNIHASDLNIDPSFLKIKVYKFAVSTSPFCTNPVTVIENDSPTYTDVLSNPDFGDGTITDGTYPCVIIEFSDTIKYAPNANSTSGNCTNGTEYTLDVCNASGGGTFKLVNGTTGTCASGEQRVAMYLSTTSTSTGGGANAFLPPVTTSDGTKGFNLGSALEVSGTSIAKFVVNGTDKICDTNDGSCNGAATSCEMQPPLFSFSKL